ncbi:hypothetical protein [uncultured Jannaschia sp.]|uniref:hypothetical protein n=1 Tax=Jannaschia halovivens TaxID=3388667 RepID=UPI00261F2C62|nr:hypothetical protein [uncultured Jannaschia sp.]
MRPVLFVLPLALCACVPITTTGDGAEAVAGPPRVAGAVATGSRVNIRMTDGARCVGIRPEGQQSGWSGVTGDCAYQLPYTVSYKQGGSTARFTIEDPQGIDVSGGQLGARAEIFVTDVDGTRRLFVSPLGSNVRLSTAPAS